MKRLLPEPTRVSRAALALGTLLWLAASAAAAAPCDVDGNEVVDQADVEAVFDARNLASEGVDDARDADADGAITVNDARACALQCASPTCEQGGENTRPVADAGADDTGLSGDSFTLDGSASSDDDGDPLAFAWAIASAPVGSQAQLDGDTTAQPSLVVDLPGSYVIELVVSDGNDESAPDSVELVIGDPVFVFDPTIRNSEVLGPAGGSVSLQVPGGFTFRLELPEGALAQPSEIALTRVASVEGMPVGLHLLGAVRLEPSGLEFSVLPMLHVEMPSDPRGGNAAMGFVSDDDGSRLSFASLRGTSREAAALYELAVSFPIAHFSPSGVQGVESGASVPPPPADAGARERAEHFIAKRATELVNAGLPIEDDYLITEALIGWFDNDTDGIAERMELLTLFPDLNDITSLQDLNREINDLLVQLSDLLSDVPGGPRESLEQAVIEMATELVASYLEELYGQCEVDTLAAQATLEILSVEIVDSFVREELKTAFEDESFECEYELNFTPAFQAGFAGLTVGLPYTITLQDGSLYQGGLDALGVEYGMTPDHLATVGVTPSQILVTKEDGYGLGSLTVEVGAGPEATAEVLFVPSFIAGYGATGTGSASDCFYPDDEGSGGGAAGIDITSQALTDATHSSATIVISGGGGVVTGISLTVSLTSIQSDSATGSASGSLGYRVTEIDEGEIYVTVGSGSLSGSVTATTSGHSFLLDFDGSDNYCNTVVGTMLMQSP